MANRYWVGGTGSWSDASNHWASTSGGSGAGGNLPTINDDVYFNAQSFDASGTITLDISANCRNFDWTGLDSSVWFTSAVQSAYIYGDVSLNTNLQWIFSGTAYAYLKSSNTQYIRSNNTTIGPTRVYLDSVSSSGYYILGDDYAATRTGTGTSNYFYVTRGTFDTNGKQFTTSYIFGTVGSLMPQILLRDSSLYVNYLRFEGDVSFGCGTSNIYIPYYLWGYGKTFYNVTITGSNAYTLSGNNTFNNLTFSRNNNVNNGVLISGHQTINNLLTIDGNPTDNRYRFLLTSATIGTKYGIFANDISLSGIDFRDISVGGLANWDLSNIPGGSGDCGGNYGITFTPAASCYFVHTSGACNWSDASKWMTSSGGTTYARVPLSQDSAIFDENSVSGNSTITLNVPRIGSLNTENCLQNLILYTASGGTQFYGKVETGITTNFNLYNPYIIGGRTAYNSIKIGNKNVPGYLYFYNSKIELLSDISTNTLRIGDGYGGLDFKSNSYNINISKGQYFYILPSAINLDFGNSIIDLYMTGSSFFMIHMNNSPNVCKCSNMTLNVYNRIGDTLSPPAGGSPSSAIYFPSNTVIGKLILDSNANTPFMIASNYYINDLIIYPNSKVWFGSNVNITILNKFIANGTSDASITIDSSNGISNFFLNASTGNTRMQVEHCFIKNSIVSPNNRWYAQNSVDLGGNSGWNFKEYSLKPIRIGNTILNKHIEK